MSEIFVSNIQEGQWQKSSPERIASGANPHLSWRYLVDASEHKSAGLSMGILKIPQGEHLPPHRHAQQEVYFILKGRGVLLMENDETRSLEFGQTVYIPGDTLHGIKNMGEGDFEVIWTFPTDSWHDVQYRFGL